MTTPILTVLCFADYELDVADRRLRRSGVEIYLAPKVFEALRFLVERRGRLVTKEELRSELWPDVHVADNALPQTISRLRKALGGDYVETVSGIGYRFVAEAAGQPRSAPTPTRSLHQKWIWPAMAAIFAVLALGTFLWMKRVRQSSPDELAGLDPAVRESYVRGRAIWARRVGYADPKAEAYMLDVVRRAPNFALGWAGLGDLYMMRARPQQQALTAFTRALELNPKLGEAWSGAGFYRMTHEWDWKNAEHDLRRGVRLAPTYEYGRKWLGEYLAITGRMPEAIAELETAVQQQPLSAASRLGLCRVFYFAGRLVDAAKQCQIAMELHPNFRMAQLSMYSIAADLGKTDDAVSYWLKASNVSLMDSANPYVVALQKGGPQGMWFEAMQTAPDTSSYTKAVYASRAGDEKTALTYLERAVNQHEFLATWTNVEPAFARLHHYPRFQALIQSMGLPMAKRASP